MASFREIVLRDMERGVRVMLRVQDDIDPQFRFATPTGDIHIAATFPEVIGERNILFEHLAKFAAMKQVLAYTMTFNLAEPNAVMTVGVSRNEVLGCLVCFEGERGNYKEADFAEPVWVEEDAIGQEFLTLLPKKETVLTSQDLTDIEAWFGRDGRYPAVYVATGRSAFEEQRR